MKVSLMTVQCNVDITRNDMANDGMDLKSWLIWKQSLSIPLNWIKKKYTFAVTFKCKV